MQHLHDCCSSTTQLAGATTLPCTFCSLLGAVTCLPVVITHLACKLNVWHLDLTQVLSRAVIGTLIAGQCRAQGRCGQPRPDLLTAAAAPLMLCIAQVRLWQSPTCDLRYTDALDAIMQFNRVYVPIKQCQGVVSVRACMRVRASRFSHT